MWRRDGTNAVVALACDLVTALSAELAAMRERAERAEAARDKSKVAEDQFARHAAYWQARAYEAEGRTTPKESADGD